MISPVASSVLIAPLRVIEPLPEVRMLRFSLPVITPVTVIDPLTLPISISDPVPVTVIVLAKETVPFAEVSRKKLLPTFTASAKVTEVANAVVWPTLRLPPTFTVPDARKILVPSAIKSPKATGLEPTVPPMVMAPEPATRVSLLPATEGLTSPVMVMLPTPEVVNAAKVELLAIKFPVTRA